MAHSPEISIVIPSRDRLGQLKRCLASIAELEAPCGGFEVVVVDDGSREPYREFLDGFFKAIHLRLLRRDGQGPGLARNAGVATAQGRFVALTDDDCAPAPDWLARLGAALRAAPDDLVGGRTVNALPENVFAEASQLLIHYLYDYFGAGHVNRFFTSCNMALRRDLYLEVGGFLPRFRLAGGEDRDFCDRWMTSGRHLSYVRDAVVHHAHHLTFRGFLRQHFTYGRGAWHFHRARAERGVGRVPIEPLRFFAGMVARPFSEPGPRRPLATSALIGTSVVMNAAGYFRERWGPGAS